MKKINSLILTISIISLSAFTALNSVQWTISEGHAIKFSGTDAEGIFKNVEATINFNGQDLVSSNCQFNIEVNSINTGNGIKNKHAKSKKWFDAKNHPNIAFKSSAFSKTDSNFVVTGTMKIRGIEKEISIPFTFAQNVFQAQFSVNRLDYQIGTMKGMMKKVSNEIKIEVSIPVKSN